MNQLSPPAAPSPATDLTVTEQALADLWIEVLRGTANPQPNDDFFAVGGDSMAMVTLEFRIKEEMGVELAPGTVLAAPTLRQLSSTIDSLLNSSPTQTAPSQYR